MDKRAEELLNCYKLLSSWEQEGLLWMIQNPYILRCFTDSAETGIEELKVLMEDARNEMIRLLLCCYPIRN